MAGGGGCYGPPAPGWDEYVKDFYNTHPDFPHPGPNHDVPGHNHDVPGNNHSTPGPIHVPVDTPYPWDNLGHNGHVPQIREFVAPHSSAYDGFDCSIKGSIQACAKNTPGALASGAAGGAVTGAVSGGIGVGLGAVLGGTATGVANCAGNVANHLNGCL